MDIQKRDQGKTYLLPSPKGGRSSKINPHLYSILDIIVLKFQLDLDNRTKVNVKVNGYGQWHHQQHANNIICSQIFAVL